MNKINTQKPSWCLSDNRTLRFVVVFLLYVAQGAPVGIFFFAIPAWLTINGASALEVGAFLSATSLPWSLKFVNGFLMDRFTYLPMGRRRIWLIGAQTIMVTALITLAAANPSPDNVAALSAFSFLIMTATTFQDVAVDGMAVDLIPEEEHARANGLMFGGQSIGIALGTAFTGITIASAGFPTAILANAGFVALMLGLLVCIRERPGERLLPWTLGQTSELSASRKADAWKPLIVQAWKSMTSRDSLYLTIAVMAQGCLYGFYVGLMPLIALNVAGWSDAQFSGLSGAANLVAGFLGICLFGFIADRFGTRRTAISTALLLGALIAIFWLSRSYWIDPNLIKMTIFVFLSVHLCLQISNCASAMAGCSLKVAATQFTLFMALGNLGITLATAALGPLEALGGYGAIILCMIGISLLCAGAVYLIDEVRRADNIADNYALGSTFVPGE